LIRIKLRSLSDYYCYKHSETHILFYINSLDTKEVFHIYHPSSLYFVSLYPHIILFCHIYSLLTMCMLFLEAYAFLLQGFIFVGVQTFVV
uniref:Ovule protein n=1 Tax=Brugia timori TaxID=42155 RepID=A0A0R3R9V5_9BILA